MAEAWKHWEGQTVNREFRLGVYLGGSQDSAVYLAHFDDRKPQTAAIKLVADDSPNAENTLARWRFASTLSHPNLIQIFQTGRCQIGDAKLLYIVMEYAEENLSHVVPYRPLTGDEARELLNPVLDALAYLHARGLVHGRIKPANIMSSSDQLKLSADGVRRAGDPISEPGGYDPPETISSPAGDVWSVGITLVEVLTQRLPSWDRNALADPHVPETLPAPLLDIARRCLRRDLRRRSTIVEIANQLKPNVVAQPVQQNASPRSIWYLIGSMILLLVSIGFISLKLSSHHPRRDAQPSRAIKEPSDRTLSAPGQFGSVVPSETKTAAPTEKQTLSGASQMSSPSPPAQVSPPPAQTPALAAQVRKVPAAEASTSGVIHQVLPDVPQKALDTIRGTVRVGIKVSVDPSGNVTDATIDSPGPSTYFANLALQAAQQWKFAPASDNSSEWVSFEFSVDGAKASAKGTAP